MDIALRNVSDRPILLSIARLELASPYVQIAELDTDDYFFRSGVLDPAFDEHLTGETNIGRSTPPSDVAVAMPTAAGKVVLVQFLDGSHWGDSSYLAEVLETGKPRWRYSDLLVKCAKTDARMRS